MENLHAKQLRKALEENSFLTLPGVYDCLSAKIAEEAGFPALFLSGGALAYGLLGRPDIGFLNLAEFGDAIKRIVSTVKVPVLADADAGFGNAIHAANTGAVYEQLGAAGLQIDDKVLPAIRPDKDEILDWELVGPKITAAVLSQTTHRRPLSAWCSAFPWSLLPLPWAASFPLTTAALQRAAAMW